MGVPLGSQLKRLYMNAFTPSISNKTEKLEATMLSESCDLEPFLKWGGMNPMTRAWLSVAKLCLEEIGEEAELEEMWVR